MNARRFAIFGLFAVAAIASGSLLAQAPQAVGTWAPSGEVTIAVTNSAAVSLADGRTLIVGGVTAEGNPTANVSLFDPVENSFADSGALVAARAGHTATLLKDGRVMIAGGVTDGGLMSTDIELFDPTTSTSTLVSLLPEPRKGHVAALLLDGTVLVAGGADTGGVILQSAVLFNPATGNVSSLPFGLQIARVNASATTLVDGRVLIAGGNDGTSDLASAEIYDRQSQVFSMTATQLTIPRQGHTAAMLLNNGGVLIAGGTSNGVAQSGADLFLPAIFPDPYSYGEGAFTGTGGMNAPRAAGIAGSTSVEGYTFAAGGGAANAEVYRFATIRTDKNDYAPGEFAVITGSGWQPGEEVTLLFQEDPAVHDDYVLRVTADAFGSIYWDQWAPEEHDLNVRFYLTATDSKSRAQVTFTDSRTITSATLNGGSSVTVLPGASITAVVNVTTATGGDGNANWRSTGWRIASAPGAVICVNHVNHDGSGTYNETFAITAPMSESTYNAYFIAYQNDTCTQQPSNTLTLTGGVIVDATNPTVTIGSTASNPTNASAIPVTVTFSEPVTGFTISDLSVGNGTAGNFAGSLADYSFDLTPSSDGVVTVDIAANAAQDAAGHGSLAAAQLSRTSDRTAPSISPDRTPAANSFGWNNTDVSASYTASDALSGLDAGSPATGSHTFNLEGAGQSHTFTVFDKAGNSASATIDNVNIDKTAPGVTATPTPAANANGWNNTDVTVNFVGTDTLSGIDNCTTAAVLSSEGAGQSASGSCIDKAGNSASATASGINIDKTAPSISPDRTPAGNSFGWNNSDVIASYTASDALSGLDAGSPATGTFTFNLEGAAQSHTFTVTDLAGNSASASISDVNIDKTAPGVTATPTPAANANGWNNTDVTVNFVGTDTLSGIDSCTTATVLSSEGANQSAPGSCTDKAGNSASATASGVNIDKTAPSISAARVTPANGHGWNNTDVTVSYSASDALSGLASPASGNHVFTAEGLGQSHTFTVIDLAGNSASASVGAINIDKTAPALAPVVSPNPVLLNGTATATPNATDALSGVQTQTCPVVSTGSVGAQNVTCSATDKADNTASAQAAYSVLYSWKGFLQPINDTAHQIGVTQSKFKLGQTVPAKFLLRDAADVSVQQSSNPQFLMSGNLGSCASYTTLESTDTVSPDVVPVYKWDGSQYHFNWSTRGLTGGVYRIYAKLADGTQPWVDICLTK